jgi:hypothetical protein
MLEVVSPGNYTARECRNEAQEASPGTADRVPYPAICLCYLIAVGSALNNTRLGTHETFRGNYTSIWAQKLEYPRTRRHKLNTMA